MTSPARKSGGHLISWDGWCHHPPLKCIFKGGSTATVAPLPLYERDIFWLTLEKKKMFLQIIFVVVIKDSLHKNGMDDKRLESL